MLTWSDLGDITGNLDPDYPERGDCWSIGYKEWTSNAVWQPEHGGYELPSRLIHPDRYLKAKASAQGILDSLQKIHDAVEAYCGKISKKED